VAGLIVLDANVIIAYLDQRDLHYDAAVELLEEHAAGGFASSVLSVAEATVHPTKLGAQDLATRKIDDLDLEILPLDEEDVLELARIRSQYGLKMPDAVVLHAAIVTRSSLATFDAALTAAAADAGVPILGIR
jgi:predicted nucleic acid-binding protein